MLIRAILGVVRKWMISSLFSSTGEDFIGQEDFWSAPSFQG